MRFRIIIFFAFPFLSLNNTFGQTVDLLKYYVKAYDSIKNQLESVGGSFKKSVFYAENAYWGDSMSYNAFNAKVKQQCLIVSYLMELKVLDNYRYADSTNVLKNYAIASLLKDTNIIPFQDKVLLSLPYTYDFNDFFGKKNWSNMFVSKLLVTRKENCHSLPYLYKMLADELGATCWLGLAPNHIYIKNRCKSQGWYNTELTSGTFPIDAWIMGSGYIPLEAIQNGIYMDTLSNQQAIALCVLDLAKEYEHQTQNYEDGFILQCCDLSLQYFPLNVQAMLLKAETLKHIYEIQTVSKQKEARDTYIQMEQIYAKLVTLGYREMPDKMYLK